MNELILVRYGDLLLKGRNLKLFVRTANDRIREKLEPLPVSYDFRHDRAYIEKGDVPAEEIIRRLQTIPGLYSFSLLSHCQVDYDRIADLAIGLIQEKTAGRPVTFKVETKRADKTIPETSMEISQIVAKKILRSLHHLTVDVHDPELTLMIEARKDGAYLFIDQVMGLGGFPIPMGGKAVCLLSGGIDSPVATFLALKKGIDVDCIHFESTPLTPIESVQKTIDLVKVLAGYAMHQTLKLQLVPFMELHRLILNQVPDAFQITIMRRMMLRIAEQIRLKRKATAIITGDSIGQVASQTLESLATIQDAIASLVLRPLANYDKLDIMAIARNLGTLDISNRPFNDCCSLYVPKNPVIHPDIKLTRRLESALDFQGLLDQAVIATKTIDITPDTTLSLASGALSLQEAFP